MGSVAKSIASTVVGDTVRTVVVMSQLVGRVEGGEQLARGRKV